MNHTRFSLFVLALILALAGGARGQAIEKKQLTLGVGGKSALYYLPLTICERLGYFKEQGLDVTIEDFRGGPRLRHSAGRRRIRCCRGFRRHGGADRLRARH